MTTGVELLNVLRNKDDYLKYRKYIKRSALDEHVENILDAMGKFFDAHPNTKEIDWSVFSTWYIHVHNSRLSDDEAKVYSLIFNNLAANTSVPTPKGVQDTVDYFVKMDAVAQAADILMSIADGDNKAQVIDAKDILDSYLNKSSVAEDEYEHAEHGLTNLITSVVRTGGFEWRLEDLNRSVGPVHKGDLVIVAARPETGKTSFICSEITHMLPQKASDDRDGIIFNNEEAESKIRLRLYNTALNKTVPDLTKDEAKAQAEYAKKLGSLDRVRIIGRPGLSTRDVEYYLKKYNPAIAVINVMHKLKGFDRIKSDVERLGKLYSWAREKAKEYDCVFMLIAQADATAEGQEWIYQHQIYGSKTEVQGEADVIITIGKVHDGKYKDTRYIHVPKNKMPPGPRTDPAMKHGYHEVAFNSDTGVFTSKAYKSRS